MNKPYTKEITQSHEIVWRLNVMEDCVSIFIFWLILDWESNLRYFDLIVSKKKKNRFLQDQNDDAIIEQLLTVSY